MITVNCIQGSPEWFAARCGVPSASNFDKIVTSAGELSKQRTKYLYQLAGERISGKSEETYQNATMQRGIEMEEEARCLYELVRAAKVEQVGICFPNKKKLYCASPDGLVGDDGLIEIKCPLIHTQVGYLLDYAKDPNDALPMDYFQQVQGGLLVTGRKWTDFVSYYPCLKPMIIRVERDEKFIKILQSELLKFNDELNHIVRRIS